MKNKIIINAVLFLLVFSSCKKPIENSNAPGVLQFSDLELIDFYDWQTASIDYIPLETNENILLSNIDKILTDSQYYYILDTKSNYGLYVFNKKGGFVRTISARGNGPGEFLNVRDFDIDNNGNIYLLDINRKRILKFNSRGVFLEDIIYDFFTSEFTYINDETFLFFQRGRGQSDRKLKHELVLWDKKEKIRSTYFPYTAKSIPYGPLHSFYKSNEIVNYCNYFGNNLYEIIEGVPHLKYQLDFGDYYLDDDLFDNGGDIRQSINQVRSKYYYGLSNYYETDSLATFRINKGEQRLMCFLWKDNQEFYVVDLSGSERIRRTNISFHFSPSNIIGVDGGYFMSSMMPYYFSRLKTAKNKGLLEIKDKKLDELLENMNPNDNPIIVKFKIPASVFNK